MTVTEAGTRVPDNLDPRRWVALAVVITAAFIVVLDNTVLNVAIPTIRADFNTTLPSLLWVVTGYALTFATFLIIGGRLGDIYGHRRIFVIGVALFGVGSFLASVSQSVPQLVIGEAVIEGIGASLMLPATLAIISTMFKGRERATAFAAWGASAGVAAAFGPVVGGFLTSNYSWRWSFRINVIIAPLAIAGAVIFMARGDRDRRRMPLDVLGAVLIAAGMFLLVFALSEGSTYGWWKPLKEFSLGGHGVWPASAPISIIPLVLAASIAILIAFYLVERAKERKNAYPLFPFAHLRIKTYRYGLLTGLVLAMVSYVAGILLIAHAVSLDITALQLIPGLAFYGIGIGFAGAQLTNVVMSEVPADSSGVASGANTTVRQVGAALGVAMIGSLLSAQILSNSVSRIRAATLPAAVKVEALAGVHANGAYYRPSASTGAHDTSIVQHALRASVASGTRITLLFAASIVVIGACLSFLIPRMPAPTRWAADNLEPLEPLDVDPSLVGSA